MPNFVLFQPKSIEEALSLLITHEGSRCIAGGQTLVAMMNAGLLSPPALVSLTSISDLHGIEWRADGTVRIGAAVSHREVASDLNLARAHSVVREAAAVIAHPAIRNFGTIGGALAHADPASDYPAAVLAADATIEVVGHAGRRTVAANDFFVDYFTTALEPGEIVAGVILPAAAPGSVGHYLKFSRVDGDYAIASIAVTLTWNKGVCGAAGLAIGGMAAIPIRTAEADAALVGTQCEVAAIDTAARLLLEHADPVDDVRASAAYRRAVLPKLLRRAVRSAIASESVGAVG